MDERPAGLADIARVFLRIGAMSYGGPAIMGILQTEIQEKRHWIGKPQFMEGVALVNMLPGPGATQLAIYLGHAKAGLAGGILAGICFILPAFAIMLTLASVYAAFGTLPSMRNAFYGIGPVVIGIFAVSVYRLGKTAIKDKSQMATVFATVALMLYTPVGLVAALLAAGCVGLALFHSRRIGLIALAALVGVVAAYDTAAFLMTSPVPVFEPTAGPNSGAPAMREVAALFLKIGTFTFGGGLTMLAFIEEQVVNQLGWLTPQEFVDGLALGQFTPGPVLMVAAFVGFKLFGVAGAAIAASAIFLPSFLMMLSILPLLRKMTDLQWLKAFMRGVGPAVTGAFAVVLVQMAPQAAPDLFTWCLLALTMAIMLVRNVGALPLMSGGAVMGWVSRGKPWEMVRDLAL